MLFYYKRICKKAFIFDSFNFHEKPEFKKRIWEFFSFCTVQTTLQNCTYIYV